MQHVQIAEYLGRRRRRLALIDGLQVLPELRSARRLVGQVMREGPATAVQCVTLSLGQFRRIGGENTLQRERVARQQRVWRDRRGAAPKTTEPSSEIVAVA